MGLLRVGANQPTEQTPAGLVLECHTRIRSFADLAVRLAAEAAPNEYIADAAARVHRYFTEALPRHVADEEQSIAPRLRRFSPEAADVLSTMERQHREHDELFARLIPAWRDLASAPSERQKTHADAVVLRTELEEHLSVEERLIVPAMARLPADEQRSILEELRARRV